MRAACTTAQQMTEIRTANGAERRRKQLAYGWFTRRSGNAGILGITLDTATDMGEESPACFMVCDQCTDDVYASKITSWKIAYRYANDIGGDARPMNGPHPFPEEWAEG